MGITQFKNTATLTLDESNPVAVPLGTPVAVSYTHLTLPTIYSV